MPMPNLDIELASLRQRRGIKWTLYPDDVLPAWVADMDWPLAPPIRDAVERLARHDDLGYAYRPWDASVPAAFAHWMQQQFGWEIDPMRIVVVSDLIQAILATIEVWTEPGDGVIIQTPIYPPFLESVQQSGRALVDNPLRRGPTRYELDIDALRQAIDDRTRLLLLCNPHNPTGRVFERAELEALAEIVLEHELIVASDEIHADLVYPGATHIPFATLGPEIAARTITLTSATKAFNIAGARCAVMYFGSQELRQRFDTIPQRLLGTPSNIGIDTTVAAWREGSPWLAAVLAQLHENRNRLTAFLEQELPEVGYLSPEGTYLAWLDCTALALPGGPQTFFLERARVALSDGAEFSAYTDQCVRLNFATTPAILDEILTRMAEAVTRHGPGQTRKE